MADENTTQDADIQQSKKITVKLKPLALKKATGGESPAAEPAAPAMKKATQVVKAAEQAEVPVVPTMKKATQVVKATEPAEAAAPEAIPVAPATPAPDATQAVKKPGVSIPKPAPAAPVTPAAPAPDSTQAVKKPGLSIPQPAPAAEATQVLKKPGLSIPKPAAPAPAAPAPAPAAPAAPAAEADPEAEAKRVQSEGLKPREGNKSGIGLKKTEPASEGNLPDGLKPASELTSAGERVTLQNASDEPGVGLTIVTVAACILLLLGTYVLFANYSKLWMPELDAHNIPQPPSGLLLK